MDNRSDKDLFDIDESIVSYQRSKDTTRVAVEIKDQAGISELKLYMILERECLKIALRLGIHPEDPDINH